MINRIIEFSVNNRFLVLLLVAALAIAGGIAMKKTPIDAIPDLSENQVIVFTDWMGRSPQEIEDQITYPLSVNLRALAGVKAVRATSEFNYSMINIIFDDQVDFYFARTRVLERLSVASTFLPAGVVPYLAPDATALGQIFWYTLEGEGRDLGELRALQDWNVRYALQAIPGVAEVASVGGFVRSYQIEVDPNLLRSYGIALGEIFAAVSRSNSSVGGNVLERNGAEILVRGIGWIKDKADLEEVVVAARGGTPILVKNLAAVQVGPYYRRSVLEKEGREVVGGVVMMRFGEDPLTITDRIKAKIEEISPGLPSGVRVVPFYERTRLIHDAMHTLTGTLTEEAVVASLVVFLVMGHFRSALLVCLVLPLSVLFAFILMYLLNIPSNIMSLSGIAISIGVLIDAGIVITENVYHQLHLRFGTSRVTGDTRPIILEACRTVGGPLFFSIVIMLLSFAPIFALSGIEGKMFHPLAFTKSFALLGVGLLAITVLPALYPMLLRGKLKPAEANWLVRTFVEIYRPMLSYILRCPDILIVVTSALMVTAIPLFPHRFPYNAMALMLPFLAVIPLALVAKRKLLCGGILLVVALVTSQLLKPLGEEFMPPLDEGSILDMPITVPRASVTEVRNDLLVRDSLIRQFPEVESVVAKGGRAETPTDPSPVDMVESVINLYPKSYWPRRRLDFKDAEQEAREVWSQLQPGKNSDKDLMIEATMDAVSRFDAWAREYSQNQLQAFRYDIGPELVGVGIDGVMEFLRAAGVRKRALTPAEQEALAARLTPRWGKLFVLPIWKAEMERFIREVTEEVGKTGGLADGRNPFIAWRETNVSWLDPVREIFGATPATPEESLRERISLRLQERFLARIKKLDGELVDLGSGMLPGALAEALWEGAFHRGLLAGKPDRIPEKVRAAVLAARKEKFGRSLFLWTKTKSDLVKELDSAVRIPGWGNIWTQPIINRIDMLATGVRTMIGVKVMGDDRKSTASTLDAIQALSAEVAEVLKAIPGAVDVFPDQSVGESYCEIEIDRRKAARYGINVADLHELIEVAIGGKAITTTVEGRQRFPVRVRYGRDLVKDLNAVRGILVAASMPGSSPGGEGGMGGATTGAAPGGGAAGRPTVQIPLSEVAAVRLVEGPTMIKSEDGVLRSYVQLNVRDRDVVGFVEEAQRAVAAKVKLPQGFSLAWSGQFEHQVRAKKTLEIVFPVVILIIFIILYFTYRDLADMGIMFVSVPGAVAGGALFQWWWGFNFSVAVWVGYIACFGMAAETAIVMLVYLREAIHKRGGLAAIASPAALTEAIMDGAVNRLRPKLLTEGVVILGLVPMLWATGTGAEIMRPMAVPLLGGILVADEVIDLLIPVLFHWVQQRRWTRLRVVC